MGAWKGLFETFRPPSCSGHGEACVLRTVLKDGPNRGRKFYVCRRPDGAPPAGRCDTFIWEDVHRAHHKQKKNKPL